MFQLEKAVRNWKKSLHKFEAFEDALIADLELHLRDEFEAQKCAGFSDEDAFRAAEAQVGTAESLAGEYRKNRLVGLNRRAPLRPSRFMPALVGNYIRVAIRKFRRQKGYALLNVAGLAVGMASCILILLWVRDELSFDRFHADAWTIHRVIVERTIHNTFRAPATPPPLAPALQKDYPEVVDSVRLRSSNQPLRYGKEQESFYSEPGILADPSFFGMFTFPLQSGDPAAVLSAPASIVISESMARTCFGDKNPLGRVLQYDANTPLRVTGVMKDVPDNSTLRFQYVIPLSFLLQRGSTFDRWDQFQLSAFIRLAPGAEARAVNAKFEEIIEKHLTAYPSKVILIPLNKLHLYGIDGKGPITYVILFSIVAVFVLLIACINFINLTTARSAQRAREVGLRKVIGARRADLIKQFLGETVIHSGFALFCALGLVLAFLPAFNTLSGKAFQAADVFGPAILPGMAAIAVFVGLLSGVYPALVLSGFQPVRTLRGAFGGARNSSVRRILVVVQFSISAILLVGTLVVSKQLHFIRDMNLGFETDNLVLTRMGDMTREAFEALKADLKRNPGIAAVTRSNASLTFLGFETTAVNWEGKTDDRRLSIQIRTVDFDYLEAMGMSMQEGRFFSKDFATDATEGFVLNETAVRSMGMQNPLGKTFDLNGTKGRIIGVVRDFYHHSLHEAIEPLIFCMNIDSYSYMFVRLTPGRTAAGLQALQANWIRIDPGYPFSYSFFTDTLADLYRTERQTGDFVRTFAALAVLIACFGLFGLAAFLAERKTKEIGIRKVAGASVSRIVVLLNKEFLKWVFVADLIGLPIAYFFLHQWLRSFAYRTAIGPGVFALAAGLSLGIAGLTVSFQSIKAGRANPIDALKFE